MSVEKTNRRRSALGRLEAQLVSGKKHEKLNVADLKQDGRFNNEKL